VNWEKTQIQLDNFIKRYRMAIIGTLLAHAFFMFILILIEISKPEIKQEENISVELAPDLESQIPLPDPTLLQSQDNEDNSNVKNISANAAEQNKSFEDYYREAENIVDNSKPKENFKANDYADQRWLAKDYSKENSIEVKDDSKENNTPANNNSSNNLKSNNTYAGKAIITYNLNGRKATRLPVPAYQCLGSGEVIIEVIVNQKGIVSSATILSSKTSLNEDCLAIAAKKSALSSRFAIDLKAPTSQKGTINYKFVQQ
jgi:outer membrane biosynthesis protein TonB